LDNQNPSTGSIDELCEIKSRYVDAMLKWYRDHVTWPRVVFRFAGLTVIVLSLAIPFLAAAKGDFLSVGVPIASFIIALITALNAFFAWQKVWEKRISICLTLEGLMAEWETEIAAAKRDSDPVTSFDKAFKATQDLIDKTRSMTVAETGAFFSTIKFPESPSSGEWKKPGTS
jgi:Protein of unknown function (DUF4231)